MGRRLFPVFGLLFAPLGAGATYGELPAGASSVAEVTGVRAEICRDHLFDAAALEQRLPIGYRLVLASELAAEDPAVAVLVPDGSRRRQYAVGSLCFMLVESFTVDGRRANARPAPMAFWWTRVAPTVELDSRMKGNVEWVQLASWYSKSGVDRKLTIAADPMAQFVPLSVEEAAPGHWRLKLRLAKELVKAEIRAVGAAQPSKRAQPGYMTVAFSGDHARYFTVYTFFGHHHQEATGTWSAKGNGRFADSFAIPEEASAFGTIFQSRWQARSGLYQKDDGRRVP